MTAEHTKLGQLDTNLAFIGTPQRTIEFLIAATAEGADLISPPNISEDLWARDLRVASDYYTTAGTLATVGEKFGLSRAGIAVIVKRSIQRLRDNSSEEVQDAFPLEDIPLYKLRSRPSVDRPLSVAQMLEAGATADQIQQKLGVNKKSLQYLFDTVSHWGIATPNIENQNLKRRSLIEKLQDPKTNDEDLRKAYQEVSSPTRLNGLVALDPPAALPLTHSLRSQGFHFKPVDVSQFLQTFNELSIPIGSIEHSFKDRESGEQKTQMYYFIAPTQQERIKRAALSSDKLSKFFHELIVSVPPSTDRLPTTTELAYKRGFNSLGNLFKELGIPVDSSNPVKPERYIQDDCPVSVYGYANNGKVRWYFPVGQKDALVKYIQTKTS
jgi:hypothetical protein